MKPHDLGPCMNGWCDSPATVHVFGPTMGPSPRITIVGGVRAAEMTADGVPSDSALGARCTDCAVALVEAVGKTPRAEVTA